MCTILKHGGPDDEGLYASPADSLVLGNRRLALLDLTPAGHQPMQFESRYWITYNGELYNFPELKEELIGLGHKFHNHTDTEVILAAYAQWNVLSFSRLKGMFAFSIWDTLQKELLLVRDSTGIKPLYYSCASGGICFASEIRAFKAVPYLQEAQSNWPVYLLAYGHIPEAITTLENVVTLHKGCFLKYSSVSGQSTLQSFRHYSFSSQLNNAAEGSSEVKKILDHAVKRHLLADAPIGVFLSGGLDSGIIASLSSKYHKALLNTLSIHFEEKAYSEKKYQDILVKKLECNHHHFLLKEADFHHSLPQILNDMDMPSCDGINTWFISKQASTLGLKAVLSGLGGDELFGGYPSFKRITTSAALQQLPSAALRSGKNSDKKKLNRLAYLNMPGIKGLYLFLRGHFTPYEIAKQLGANETEIWNILAKNPILPDLGNLTKGNQASWMEFNLYMQNQLLRDADIMSMIHGVEIRVPFLDVDVVQLAFKIKSEVKFTGPFSKQLPRASVNPYLQ